MTAILRLAPAVLLSTAVFAQDLQINEIRIDQPGGDNDEYFELIGVPGTSLDGHGYVVLGDASGNIGGVVETSLPLDGLVIPDSGYLLVAESSFSLGMADFTGTLNFENSDNVTHLLVFGTLPAQGDDLDTDDDGTLEGVTWSSVVDGIALVEDPMGGDLVYDNLPNTVAVGPNGNFVPAHVYRCLSGVEIGEFGTGAATETPGFRNLCNDPRINEIRIDQPGGDDDEYFELAGPAGGSLDGLTYLSIGDSGSAFSGVVEASVSLDGLVFDADGLLLVAESSFTLATADVTESFSFENSDNLTHLLVSGTAPAVGDDLDTDDDGILDITPWSAVVDGVALVETPNPDGMNGNDFFYDNLPNVTSVGPDGNFVPGHVFRCGNDFRIGDFGTGAFTETPGDFNVCSAPTEVFCAPAMANSVSATGSQIALESMSGGSIAANDSSLVVTNTPDDFGLFAQSPDVMAPVALASGGNLCLGFPNIQRISGPMMASGNSATLALDFAGAGPDAMVSAGVTMYYQWWHRDNPMIGSNLSEGLAVTWLE